MRDAVIVDAVRTPVGKRDGALSRMHAVAVSAHVLGALTERTGLEPGLVDDVIWGCVGTLGMQAGCIARSAVLAAGWPSTSPESPSTGSAVPRSRQYTRRPRG